MYICWLLISFNLIITYDVSIKIDLVNMYEVLIVFNVHSLLHFLNGKY